MSILDTLQKQISEGSIASVYALKGEDDFLLMRAYALLRSVADPIDTSVFTPRDGIDGALDSLECFPMLGTHRLVVLDGFPFKQKATDDEDKGKDATAKKALSDYALNPNPTSVLVLMRCGWEPKGAEIIKCAPPTPQEAAGYLELLAAEKGLSITRDAATALLQYTENDLSLAEQELVKLHAYTMGAPIDKEAVTRVVSPTVSYAIFAYTDALSRANYADAYSVIRSLASAGFDYSAFLGQAIKHYRGMLYARISRYSDDELADMLGVKAYSIKIARRTAGKYAPMALLRLLKLLYQLEYEFKSGATTAEQALEYATTMAIEALHQS